MAQNRRSQRGVIQTATTAIIVAFGVLLTMAGCSADEGSGGNENLGSLGEPLACKLGCPQSDSCGTWSCNKLLMCEVKPPSDPAPMDGDKCITLQATKGACYNSQCCGGCYTAASSHGVLDCSHLGNEDAFCGQLGTQCEACTGTDPCTAYSCDKLTRKCRQDAIADGVACNGQPGVCYKGSCCAGCIDGDGVCQKGTTPDQCGQSNPQNGVVKCASCDDKNPCNNDICQAGVCAAPTPNNNGVCSDGNLCNGTEVCSGGSCQGGTNLNCDDKNPCTADSCDPTLGCVNKPVEAGTNCDNNANVCDGSGACNVKGECVAIPALKCDDGNPCTDDKCDSVKGCTTTNNTASCSDNNLCTTNDKCSGGSCVGGPAPNCADKESCTNDTCDPAVGCVNAAVKDGTSCDDSNACTATDKCVGGVCKGSGGPSCDDSNPCTQNFCDVANNQSCTNPPENDGIPCTLDKCHQNSTCTKGQCGGGIAISCDDSNPCTVDSCDPQVGCKHEADAKATCSDGDLCTTGDACVNGECKGTAKTCKAIDNCHVAGTCNDKTGQCDDPRADDDTPCQNGTGTCQSGVCTAGPGPGAGGEGGGGDVAAGGDGNTGPSGGKPGSVGTGGEGNEPSGEGGAPVTSTGGSAGKAGNASSGSSNSEGGAADVPEHVFTRDPGGCSCSVPTSPSSRDLTGLAALAVGVGMVVRRRRRRAA